MSNETSRFTGLHFITSFISYATGQIEKTKSCQLTTVHSDMMYGLGVLACEAAKFTEFCTNDNTVLPPHVQEYVEKQKETLDCITGIYANAFEKIIENAEDTIQKVLETEGHLTPEGYLLVRELAAAEDYEETQHYTRTVKLTKLADII